MTRIKTSKKLIPAHLLAAFPEYTGRKFNIEVSDTYFCQSYWSGGTRYQFVLVHLETGEQKFPDGKIDNPFNTLAHSSFNIPEGWCVVEHGYFCGKDVGLRFYIHPKNMNNSLIPSSK